jgi:hypothetical protein
MPKAAQNLDLGKLLRMQAMVTAAQVTATASAGQALVRAYMGLVAEMNLVLQGDGLEELREEFARLFTPIEEPHVMNERLNAVGAASALVKLRQLGGWIQGLIDERTFEQRLRIEAEEKAKLAEQARTEFGL